MICIKLVHAVDSVERGIERQLADRMNGERGDRIWSKWGGRGKGETLGSTIVEISRDGSYRGECIISRYNIIMQSYRNVCYMERGKYSTMADCSPLGIEPLPSPGN